MIIDLRDYTVTRDGRDKLIARVEGLLFPEQERMGAHFLGAFRDADDPMRFVFLRAMPDLATRQRVLTEFYGEGEMWRRNRDEVNGWIVDSDNVLLLRPISAIAPPATGPSVVGMYTHLERQPLADTAAAALQEDVARAVADAGGRLLVTLATDPAENNYPKHPIRTGEHGLVWLASFGEHRPLALRSVEQRRLSPTAGSRMR